MDMQSLSLLRVMYDGRHLCKHESTINFLDPLFLLIHFLFSAH